MSFRKTTIFFFIVYFILFLPSSNCLANSLSVTVNSSIKGKYYVEFQEMSYCSLSEFSFLIEDNWKFKDIRKEVIQFKHTTQALHINHEVVYCYAKYTYTHLFWKENGSYAISAVELEVEYGGCDKYTIKISLLHFKKYSQMLDYNEAIITFRNGSSCLLKEFIPIAEFHMEGFTETQLFLAYHENPPDFLSYSFMIPPDSQVGEEIDYGCVKGVVTDNTEVLVGSINYNVIEVLQPWVQLESKNASETIRYYERETGLIIKAYSLNESTGEEHDMYPEEIFIVPLSKINYSYFSFLGLIILTVLIMKRKRKKQK